jgi:hypothetical protein
VLGHCMSPPLSLNARYGVPLEHCIGTGDVKIFFLESVIAGLKPVFLSVHSILAFLEQHDVVLHLILIAPSNEGSNIRVSL